MAKKKNKIPFTFFINPNDLTRLEEISKQTDHSVGSLIREAIKYWLREKELYDKSMRFK